MKYTRKDWMRIREVLRNRNIHHDQVKHINCIRIHPTESDEHFYEKVKVCRALFKEGKPFITEAWTNDRKQRFDILNLFDDEDIEIETGKSKLKTYKGDNVMNVDYTIKDLENIIEKFVKALPLSEKEEHIVKKVCD